MQEPEEERLRELAARILKVNLGLSPGEKCLFFTDSNSKWETTEEPDLLHRRRFLHRFYEAFTHLRSEYPNLLGDKYESTRRHGSEPRENVWRLALGDALYEELLSNDYIRRFKERREFSEEELDSVREASTRLGSRAVNAVVAFPWFSTTHTRFRELLNSLGCRYVSMPLFTETVMSGPMQADWDDVAKRTDLVHSMLVRGTALELTCPAGTDLEIEIWDADRVHKDTGLFHNPGAYGNLPAGEAYLVPQPGSASGRVVFTSAPGMVRIEPTAVIVQDGEVTATPSDTDYASELRFKFDQDIHMRHIAELGIGTNPKASDPSSMVEGEKILGTVHVALGTDKSMGGNTEAEEHLDHIIQSPTLTLHGAGSSPTVLLRAGRPLWGE